MRKFVLPVVIEKDKDGYFVFCPTLQGCYTQGDSYEEALNNIEDAIRLHIEERLASSEPLPASGMVSLATLDGCESSFAACDCGAGYSRLR